MKHHRYSGLFSNPYFYSVLLLVLFFAVGIFSYPKLPYRMASHWNAKGEADGFMPRFWGVFLFPLISVGLFLLFILIPLIDPLRKNIERFRSYYDNFILIFMIFFFYIYLLSLLWNLNFRFNMNIMLIPAISILFYYVGVVVGHAKRNWFIGVRTPWTLSSDLVWKKTHKLGGKLFKFLALLILISLFFPNEFALIVLISVLAVSFYIIVYSYFEYQREKEQKKRN